MRILLLNDYGTATGGAELQMLSLRRDLQNRGHEVRLFTSRAMMVPHSPMLADNSCFGTTGHLQVISQVANPSAVLRLQQVLGEFQPQVVHVRMFMWQLSPLILPLLTSIPSLYQTAVYKAICPLGTKTLPNGDLCEYSAGRSCLSSGCLTPQSWLAFMIQHHLWQAWKNVFDRVVALSYGMKSRLESAGISPIEVIYNGVPERPPRPRLSEPPTVAYAGRLVREKGVHILLEAMGRIRHRIPEARLLIAGRGPEEKNLREFADELGLRSMVNWLGHLPRKELEQQFDSAWIQVIPSLWDEPFGNVTTEAMMRGTAVIASAVGAQPEVVCHQETGLLVEPGDVSALETALLQLLSCRDQCEYLGWAGRERALTDFSERQRTDRFLNLYHQLQETCG